MYLLTFDTNRIRKRVLGMTVPTTTTTASTLDQAQHDGAADPATVLNINVGVLGHVDSGKTSLVKALSTLLSTAALDKSKQSRQRGMTLDLGFSCFFLDIPIHLQQAFPSKKLLQITLVDCPGHASLIRTIIGGAQIIDVVLLVVDAVKGWQAQTTECLVLAELCSPHLVVALNKVDQFPIEQRDGMIEQARVKVLHRLRHTRFHSVAPVVGVSACVGGEKVAAENSEDHAHHHNSSVAAKRMRQSIWINSWRPLRRSYRYRSAYPPAPFTLPLITAFPFAVEAQS
jgi:small GTP-binding protein